MLGWLIFEKFWVVFLVLGFKFILFILVLGGVKDWCVICVSGCDDSGFRVEINWSVELVIEVDGSIFLILLLMIFGLGEVGVGDGNRLLLFWNWLVDRKGFDFEDYLFLEVCFLF